MNQDELIQEMLQIAFERFYETAEWPSLRPVYLAEKRRHPDIDPTLDDFRQYFGLYSGDNPFSLMVWQLARVKGDACQSVLNDFLRVVHFIGQTQLDSADDNPRMTGAAVRNKFPELIDLAYRRVLKLVEREGFILGSGTGGENFDCDIGPETHRYASADSIAAYLAIRDRIFPPPQPATVVTEPPESGEDFITIRGFRPPTS
jgi:hypothetical protein